MTPQGSNKAAGGVPANATDSDKYNQARKLYDSGNYQDAQALMEELMKKDPQTKDWRLLYFRIKNQTT